MELSALVKTLPEGPGWAIVGIVLVVIFGPTGLLSKRMAEENFGGLSRAAQWWQDRKRRAIERDRQVESAEVEAMTDRLEGLRRMYEEDRERTDRELSALRETNHQLSKYLVFVTRWGHDLSLVAAREGWRIPELPTFEQWMTDNAQ